MTYWIAVGFTIMLGIAAVVMLAEIIRLVTVNWIRDWHRWRRDSRIRRLHKKWAADADRRAKESYIRWIDNDMRHPSRR